MQSESTNEGVPPCPQCSSVATVLYGNREPAYVRCNNCGHVWEPAVDAESDTPSE
jgi:uncharacterized Zn finger protein